MRPRMGVYCPAESAASRCSGTRFDPSPLPRATSRASRRLRSKPVRLCRLPLIPFFLCGAPGWLLSGELIVEQGHGQTWGQSPEVAHYGDAETGVKQSPDTC